MSALLPALRGDLQLTEGAAGLDGAPQWILSDPLTGCYFKLTPAAMRLLRHWSRRDPKRVLAAANREPGLALQERELEQLLSFLRGNDLIAAGDSEQRKGYAAKAKARRSALWKRLLHQYLFFRIPLWRPDPLLNRCWPWLERYGAFVVRLVLPLVLMLGIYLVGRDWAAYTHAFPHLFSLPGLVAFGTALIVAKFVHEMGHALLAKRAGCRVQSMGVAFIVLLPLFYTDVSDAWKLKEHRTRMLIGAGGVLAELMLAAVALLAWALLPEGPLRTAVFMLSSVTWVTTVIVNLNPLMRFDGYFLLADYWRVDNLQMRAFALCRWRLREALFRYGRPAPESWSPGMQRKLLIWGYAAWIWRFFLFLGIALIVYHFFIKAIGIGLMAVELCWFIALPIAREIKIWWSMRKESHPGALVRTAVIAGLALLLLLYPWYGRISVPAMLEAERVSTLYAPRAAQVKVLHVSDGQRVTRGDPLLELVSTDLEYRLEIERRQIEILQTQLLRGAARSETVAETGVLDRQLAESLARYRGLLAQREQLLIRAPQAGRIRDLTLDLTEGRWIAADAPLLRVVAAGEGRVQGYLPENSLAQAREGMRGYFIADDPAWPRVAVQLQHIAPTGSPYLQQEAMASDRQGPIAVRRDEEHRPRPIQAQYGVLFAVAPEAALPERPLRGSVILEGDKESIIGGIWRRLVAVGIRESGF